MKKLKIHSIDSFITNLCKLLPPSTKEDLKTINNLKLFIEKYVDIEENNDLEDELINKIAEISYHRKDSCIDLSNKYKEWIHEMYSKIDQCTRAIQFKDIDTVDINCCGLEEFKKINFSLCEIQNKIDKLIEEKKEAKNDERCLIKYFKTL